MKRIVVWGFVVMLCALVSVSALASDKSDVAARAAFGPIHSQCLVGRVHSCRTCFLGTVWHRWRVIRRGRCASSHEVPLMPRKARFDAVLAHLCSKISRKVRQRELVTFEHGDLFNQLETILSVKSNRMGFRAPAHVGSGDCRLISLNGNQPTAKECRRGSGLVAGFHGHGYEGADEGRGEELADDGFNDGQRARERMHRCNSAADRGKRAETEICKFRRELIQVRRRGNKIEGAGDKLLNQLKGGSPSQA